jgi:hypothetical protein
MGSCTAKMHPALPTYDHVVNQGIKEVIQLISQRFRWSRYDSCQVHVLGFVPDIKGEI